MQPTAQETTGYSAVGEWVVVKEVKDPTGSTIVSTGAHAREQLGLEVEVAFPGSKYDVGTRLIVNMTVSTSIRLGGVQYRGIPIYNVIMKNS